MIHRSHGLPAFFGVIVLAGSLGCSQRPGDDPYSYFYRAPMTPFFTSVASQDGSRLFQAGRLGNVASDLPKTFVMPKPPGTLRAFVIGGSVVQLFDEKTLLPGLARARPGMRLEIIDCGMSGYDSARDLLTVAEVLSYDPDLLILMSGVNDGGPPEGMGLARLPSMLAGLARALWSPARLRAWWLQPKACWPQFSDAGVVQDFERNIREIVRLATRRGVPLILCTCPVNIRDMPPRGEQPLHIRPFFEAAADLDRKDLLRAAEGFAGFIRSQETGAFPNGRSARNLRAFGHFYLGKCLWQMGEHDRAREQFVLSQHLQRPAVLTLNDRLRGISREGGASLADLEASFARAAPHGAPGFDLFEDDVHWERHMDSAVARELISSWEAGATPGRPDAGLPRDRRSRKDWTVFKHRVWDQRIGESPRFSDRVIALFGSLLDSEPRRLDSPDALKAWLQLQLRDNIWNRDTADRIDQWWPHILAHIGELLLRRRRYANALRFFDGAIRLDEQRPYWRFRRAAALAGMGRSREAEEQLGFLRPQERDYPEIRFYRERLAEPGSPARR